MLSCLWHVEECGVMPPRAYFICVPVNYFSKKGSHCTVGGSQSPLVDLYRWIFYQFFSSSFYFILFLCLINCFWTHQLLYFLFIYCWTTNLSIYLFFLQIPYQASETFLATFLFLMVKQFALTLLNIKTYF